MYPTSTCNMCCSMNSHPCTSPELDNCFHTEKGAEPGKQLQLYNIQAKMHKIIMSVLCWTRWAERYWAKERKSRLTNKHLFCHYWRDGGLSPAILLDKSSETWLKCWLSTCIYKCGISPCSSALDSHPFAALRRMVATTLKQKLSKICVFFPF